MKRHAYDEILDKNPMMQIEHDYETPFLDRQNKHSQVWHAENREKAKARMRTNKRKTKFERNAKWHKAFGGLT